MRSTAIWQRLVFAVFAATLLAAPPGSAAPAPQPEPIKRMMAQGYYFREPTDRAWTLKVTGNIPSLPGAFFILHNAAGKLIYKGHIPHGEYSVDKPFVIKIPADGMVGDYKLNILGSQNDFLGIDLPMSDLPFESYSGGWLSIGQLPKAVVPFKARPGTTVLGFRAYHGFLKIMDDGMQVVADARAGLNLMTPSDANKNFYNKRDNPIEFTVDPARHYWLTGEMMYFEPREQLFFATEPGKIFVADPKLDEVKWWEL